MNRIIIDHSYLAQPMKVVVSTILCIESGFTIYSLIKQ